MIPVAFVKSCRSRVVEPGLLSWEELSSRLANCDIGEKDGPGWMPAEIASGPRTATRVNSNSLLVLDVEPKSEMVEGGKKIIGPEPTSPQDLTSEISLFNFKSIVHTSYSHDLNHPRYRVVFDLSRHLKAGEIKPLGLHVAELLGLTNCVDTGCLEAARLFYLPRCSADRMNLFFHATIEGEALDVDQLLNEAAKNARVLAAGLPSQGQNRSDSIIEAFNYANEIGKILEDNGYQPQRGKRWLWPASTSGTPGVRILPESTPARVYSSHPGDPLCDGRAHDAFDLFRIFKHGGDVNAAVKAAAKILRIDTQRDRSASNGQQDDEIDAQSCDAVTIERLAKLPPFEYDRLRKDRAFKLGVQLKTLDAMVTAARLDIREAEDLIFVKVEPSSEPIDPAQVLNELSDLIRQFIVLEKEQADATALWITFTWFIDAVKVAPLAIITAPEKACGKSQLLALFGRLVARPLPAANATPAALFRSVEKWGPTILIDEADTFMRDSDELKGLINAGHTRENAFALRLVGDDHEPRRFTVWGAKALAGISLEKHLSDATMSRAIVFELRRKLASESVNRLRHADGGSFAATTEKLARFAADFSEKVRRSCPNLPDGLDDRQQDNWEPLFAIAECASPEWVERATAAALKLSGTDTIKPSIGNELLSDIRQIFEIKNVEKISSADLISALCEDDEGAWSTYNRGKPINAKQVARQLAPYAIKSKTIRTEWGTPKGYEFVQFSDVFERYLAMPKYSLEVPQCSIPENFDEVLSMTGDSQQSKKSTVTAERFPEKSPPEVIGKVMGFAASKLTENKAATPEAAALLACGGVAAKNENYRDSPVHRIRTRPPLRIVSKRSLNSMETREM